VTIRTVTLSTGFDHDVVVDRIDSGVVGSVLSWHTYSSGKGLNVSRMVHALGGDTVAYALIGDAEQDVFAGLAARDGYIVASVPIAQPTRNNLTLRVESSGAASGHATGRRFSEVPDDDVEKLFELVLADISAGDVVSFNGSLPEGFRPSAWADVAARICALGAKLFADVQGDAMIALFETGLVHASKPNEQEALDLLHGGEDRPPVQTAVAAVRRMRGLGVVDPIVTLGPLGAVHIVDGVVVRSECPTNVARVEVGAGDAFVAGYCSAIDAVAWRGRSPVALGLATASAHVDGLEGVELAANIEQRLTRVASTALAPL
jgi:1-phosphofructokinase